MTTGPGTPRLSSSETARSLLALMANRAPAPAESTVTIGTTAKHGSAADPEPKRLHTWEITVRGEDVGECARRARVLDDALSAAFAHELEAPDNLAAQLAASVVKGGK
jgi:hypothetical protein